MQQSGKIPEDIPREDVPKKSAQVVFNRASVLNSERAIEVNIAIMRAFVKLRRMLASNDELSRKLEDLEKKYDEQFRVVFEAIRQLMTPPEPRAYFFPLPWRERQGEGVMLH
jgi:hypothetical protein